MQAIKYCFDNERTFKSMVFFALVRRAKLQIKSCTDFIVRECLLLLYFSKAHFFTKTHGLRFYCLFGSCSEYINRRYVLVLCLLENYIVFLCSEYRYYPTCLVLELISFYCQLKPKLLKKLNFQVPSI